MHDPVTESIITSAVLNSLVLLLFSFRLWIRIRMQRVGWEDIWATVAFICGMLNAASDWVYLIDLWEGRYVGTPLWIYIFTFTCIVWSVRISILFSIIRIIPVQERLHAYGLMIITFFLVLCSTLIVLKAIFCNHAYHVFAYTKLNPFSRCNRFHAISVTELAVGSIADIVTVAFPLYVLRNVTLSQQYLRLLRRLFSSSIILSILCFIGVVFRVVPALSHWSMFVTNLQVATSLIVCNLLVVVTYLYRVLRCQKHRATTSDASDEETTVDEEEDDTTEASTIPRQMTLTTIDLLFSAYSGEHRSVATVP